MNLSFNFLCIILVLCTILSVVDSSRADQSKYPACPINHNSQKFCCDYGTGEKYLFTIYHLPDRDAAYRDDYQQGWYGLSRQINFPYTLYRPQTPSFYYNDSNNICRIRSYLNDKKEVVENLQCGNRSNASLPAASLNANVFVSYPGNSRNNNASCPDGAKWSVIKNIDEEDACIAIPVPVITVYSTFLEAPFSLTYFLYFIGLILIIFWIFYKRTKESNSYNNLVNKVCLVGDARATYFALEVNEEAKRIVSLTESDEAILAENEDIIQCGYNSNKFGNIVASYLVILSFFLHVILFVIILDYYYAFGKPLMPRDEGILKAFIVVYCLSTVWFILIVIFQQNILRFFKIKSPLEISEYVHMFKPEYSEIMLSDRSGISDLVNRVENIFFSKSKPGHGGMIKVQQTSQGSRYIEFQYLRYIYNSNKQRFIPASIPLPITYNDIQNTKSGLTTQEYTNNFNLIGYNMIKVEMPSMSSSLVLEFFTFFYIYQFMSYYVWFYYDYYYMAMVMVIIILFSAIINIYTKRRMQAAVIEMSKYHCDVTVCRDNVWQTVSSRDLVPGDLINVQENSVLPCDMVIVKGSTVCDESNLTGESMPVQKFAIPDSSHDNYELNKAKKHSLFAGTKVLSSGRKEKVLAVVRLTGAHTSRGQLIQNILFPTRMRFKYDEHLKVLLCILGIYTIFSSYLTVKFLVGNGHLEHRLNAFGYIVFMVSGIMSPLLPVVITVGQVTAAQRLEEQGIFSLNCRRLALAGKVRVFCFDKTGTLTKQGLDFLGCKPVENNRFLDVISDIRRDEINEIMMIALASCHSLGSLNGELVGNEVEVKMFKATGWKLIEEEGNLPFVCNIVNNRKYVLVKRFEFDHRSMSMSVVVKDLETKKYLVFCKGSYETIKGLCLENTVPQDYQITAEKLARDGCYVLSVSFKDLGDSITQEELENLLKSRDTINNNLSLLGLIMFRNELKPEAREAILHLKKGDIRTVMITGDNAMCGCYIAKQCGMVNSTAQILLGDIPSNKNNVLISRELIWTDIYTNETFSTEEVKEIVHQGLDIELALTCKGFYYMIRKEDMNELLFHVRIFSRMTPEGKVECVKMHMTKGAVTGMCGDGGNDCGALRIAHVGIALSDAEASIVSPFTSKFKTVTSVVDLCREGRCSVTTSFASVKFLIMYGLITSNLNHITNYNGISNGQWFWILCDGFITVGFCYFMTLSKPLKALGNQRPTSSLIGPTTIFSILGQQFINILFLALALYFLDIQTWYCPFSIKSVDLAKWWLLGDNAITTVLFYCIVFQLQTSAFVFTFGGRHRESVWKNYGVCSFYLMLTLLNIYLMIGSPSYLTDLFRIASGTNVIGLPDIPIPLRFRIKFLVLVLANILSCVLFEGIIILGPVRSYFRKKYYKDNLQMKI